MVSPFDNNTYTPGPKPLDNLDNLYLLFFLSQLEQIRKDIRDFRSSAGLDKVIVLWTANTERFCEVVPGRNDTAENLLRTIQVGIRPRFLGIDAIPEESLTNYFSALSLAWKCRHPRFLLWPASWRAVPSSTGPHRTHWCPVPWSWLRSAMCS